MQGAAEHKIFGISDSDVLVTPDYLRAVVATFADDSTGLATCLYRGVALPATTLKGRSFWSSLEAVGMSVEMSSGVLVAEMLEGMAFALGPTMVVRRDCLDRAGGFTAIGGYHGDDFMLGRPPGGANAIVNQFTANYGRIRFNSGNTTDPSGIFGLTGNTIVGIPSNPQLTAGFSLQSFNGIEGGPPSPGNNYPSSFGANPTPEIFIDNIFGYTDNLTFQHGRHLLKFGGAFLRYQQNSFYPGNDGELGNFTYTGAFTAGPNASTLYPFAGFVTDRVYDVQTGAVTGRTGQRQWRDSVFAQDDFKVSPNFTLNLGIRWEYDQPIYEVNNKMATINMRTKQIEYAGVDGNSRALYNSVWTQFQPRIGFAFQPTPRTVIRGGYGISSYFGGHGRQPSLDPKPAFPQRL